MSVLLFCFGPEIDLTVSAWSKWWEEGRLVKHFWCRCNLIIRQHCLLPETPPVFWPQELFCSLRPVVSVAPTAIASLYETCEQRRPFFCWSTLCSPSSFFFLGSSSVSEQFCSKVYRRINNCSFWVHQCGYVCLYLHLTVLFTTSLNLFFFPFCNCIVKLYTACSVVFLFSEMLLV